MREIEKKLGRTLESGHNSVETLNDVTPAMIEELRLLADDQFQSRRYLQFHVRLHRAELDDFITDVVLGGQDPAAWGFQDVLVTIGEGTRIVSFIHSWSDVQKQLEVIDGRKWFRRSLPETPAPPSEEQGSVGVMVQRRPYWQKTPKGLHGFSGCAVERIDDAYAPLAYRRWIASRASWWARTYLAEVGSNARVDEIIHAAGVDAAVVTHDARIALSALVRERGSSELARQPSGFAGPDDWYRD